MVDDTVVGGLPLSAGDGGEHVADVDHHGAGPARHWHPGAVWPLQLQTLVLERRDHGDEAGVVMRRAQQHGACRPTETR